MLLFSFLFGCISRFEFRCLLSVCGGIPKPDISLDWKAVTSLCCFAGCCFHNFLMNRSAAILRFSESRQYVSLRHSHCLDIAVISVISIVFRMLCGIIVCLFLSLSDIFRHDCQTATPSAEGAECLTTSKAFQFAPGVATLACTVGSGRPARPFVSTRNPQVCHQAHTMRSSDP